MKGSVCQNLFPCHRLSFAFALQPKFEAGTIKLHMQVCANASSQNPDLIFLLCSLYFRFLEKIGIGNSKVRKFLNVKHSLPSLSKWAGQLLKNYRGNR